MIVVTAVYDHTPGARFDHDHYARVHLPLVRARWGEAGLISIEGLRGVVAFGGGEPRYGVIAILRFESQAAFEAAATGPHAAEIDADIANFTDLIPDMQVNKVIG